MATYLTPPRVPDKPLTIAILGCGSRGYGYATFALHFPQWLKVVAVADHHDFKCQKLAKEHGIPQDRIFNDWREMAKVPKLADTVAICTTDREHAGPAIAFANLGYRGILLEKPMSTSMQECVQIHDAVVKNGTILAVCHVLRYTKYTKAVKRILDSKILGDIISIQHLEPVGWWHFAHSFVRGNWHNEEASTFSLLAKSCHDIDLVTYMMGSKCRRISSFGNLSHFKKENKPKEAGNAKNCLDCAYEESCPYSAKKIYIDKLQEGRTGWPVNVVQPKDPIDVENLTEALRTKDYGRCVYEMDNDVCDHQVVNMEFENGSTVAFSMVAFTESLCDRKTRIFGTRGELEGDGVDTIQIFDFLTRTKKVVRPSQETESDGLPASGHGGGDFGLMRSFVYACVSGNQDYIVSGPQETLDTHIYCFAGEYARKTGTVVDIEDFKKSTIKA